MTKGKRKICRHFAECTQEITRSQLGLCLGKVKDWHQEDCYTHNDLLNENPDETKKKLPRDWLGKRRLKEYGFLETEALVSE